jgi:hypothetical protein
MGQAEQIVQLLPVMLTSKFGTLADQWLEHGWQEFCSGWEWDDENGSFVSSLKEMVLDLTGPDEDESDAASDISGSDDENVGGELRQYKEDLLNDDINQELSFFIAWDGEVPENQFGDHGTVKTFRRYVAPTGTEQDDLAGVIVPMDEDSQTATVETSTLTGSEPDNLLPQLHALLKTSEGKGQLEHIFGQLSSLNATGDTTRTAATANTQSDSATRRSGEKE